MRDERLADDGAFHGTTRADLIGVSVPILAVMGDQHGAMIGLGCVNPGDSMVVHGTGSFVDLLTGDAFPQHPELYEATTTLTGWRTKGRSVFSVETFTSTTGSAFDWFCEHLGWFDSALQISELAATASDSGGVEFIPALTGVRSPVLTTKVRASLSTAHRACSGRSQVAATRLRSSSVTSSTRCR